MAHNTFNQVQELTPYQAGLQRKVDRAWTTNDDWPALDAYHSCMTPDKKTIFTSNENLQLNLFGNWGTNTNKEGAVMAHHYNTTTKKWEYAGYLNPDTRLYTQPNGYPDHSYGVALACSNSLLAVGSECRLFLYSHTNGVINQTPVFEVELPYFYDATYGSAQYSPVSITIVNDSLVCVGEPNNGLNTSSNYVGSAGIVMTYKKTGATWAFSDYLEATVQTTSSYFGTILHGFVDGQGVSVLSVGADGDSTDPNDGGTPDPGAGAVYHYVRNAGNTAWTRVQKTVSSYFGSTYGGGYGSHFGSICRDGIITFLDFVTNSGQNLKVYEWNETSQLWDWRGTIGGSDFKAIMPGVYYADVHIHDTWYDSATDRLYVVARISGEEIYVMYRLDRVAGEFEPVDYSVLWCSSASSAAGYADYFAEPGYLATKDTGLFFLSFDEAGLFYVAKIDWLWKEGFYRTYSNVYAGIIAGFDWVSDGSAVPRYDRIMTASWGVDLTYGTLTDGVSANMYFGLGALEFLDADTLIIAAYQADCDVDGKNFKDKKGSFYKFENVGGTWTINQDASPKFRAAYYTESNWGEETRGITHIPSRNALYLPYDQGAWLVDLDTGHSEPWNYYNNSNKMWRIAVHYAPNDWLFQVKYNTTTATGPNNTIELRTWQDQYGGYTNIRQSIFPALYVYVGDGWGMGLDLLTEFANPVLIVGAPFHDWDETISVNITDAGAVYSIEVTSVTAFAERDKRVAPYRHANMNFGRCIAVEGDLVAVGAPGAYTDALGGPDMPTSAGAVYMYRIDANKDLQYLYQVVAPTPAANARFGHTVRLRNGFLIVAEGEHDGTYIFELGANKARCLVQKYASYSGANSRGIDAVPLVIGGSLSNRMRVAYGTRDTPTVSGVAGVGRVSVDEVDLIHTHNDFLVF